MRKKTPTTQAELEHLFAGDRDVLVQCILRPNFPHIENQRQVEQEAHAAVRIGVWAFTISSSLLSARVEGLPARVQGELAGV